MRLKGLIFDIDGTLANTLPMCIESYRGAFQRLLGRRLTTDEITAHFGLTEAGIFKRITPEHWELGLQHYFEIYEQLHEQCREPFDHIKTALQLLQERGVKMGVVTGKGMRGATYTLHYLGIHHYFSTIEAGADHAIVKSQAIRKIVHTWHLDPGEVAYIGDTDTDMQEAKDAGVLPLAAEWAETATTQKLTAMQPYAAFPTVEHFIAWIEEHVNL